MPIAVEMPKMGDTMEEGVLVAWLVEEGDRVEAGEAIAQVETDKATLDLEVYDDGVVLRRVVEEGASVPVGGLVAVLGKEGEDPAEVIARYGENGAAPAEAPADADASASDTTSQPAPPEEQPVAAEPEGDGLAEALSTEALSAETGRLRASPLARRMAQEAGLDLAQLQGSGPEGRIIKRDIEAALAGRAPAPAPAAAPAPAPAERAPAAAPAEAPYERLPISQMRKTIARRLSESKFTSPHFYLTLEVDMARAVEARARLNELAEAQGRARISYNDLITKACAAALRLHPQVNSSYLEKEGEIRRHHEVHVAVAVAVEEGLLTPVIRHADRKGLAEIAEETRALAERARERTLQPQDWEGSTFTTSNLGMFGIEEFTAIINPPNACILAIGAIREVPVVKDGEVVAGTRMMLTLSCDHRVVDGATGARFLAEVQRLLEEPMNLLL